jgi:hypothetical protein
VSVLAWRAPSSQRNQASKVRVPGAYAGRARFRPVHLDELPGPLLHVVGRVGEFGFAGIAPSGEPFAGQELYLEWCRDDLFSGFIIPEQDLEFLKDSKDPTG